MLAHAQARDRADWSLGWVQSIVNACRGLHLLASLDTSGFGHTVRNAVTEMLAALRLVYQAPSDTRAARYLEFGHFGAEFTHHSSRFDLTAVSQDWLRGLLWDYTADRLRSPQGPRSRSPSDHARRAIVDLSGFLEARAPGGGHDPALLPEQHARAFAADMRHRAGSSLPAPGVCRRDGRPSIVTDKSRHAVLNSPRKTCAGRWRPATPAVIGLDRGFIVALPYGGGTTQHRRPFHRPGGPRAGRRGKPGSTRGRTTTASTAGCATSGRPSSPPAAAAARSSKLRLDCTGRYDGLPLLWHDQTKVGNYDEAIRIPESIYQRLPSAGQDPAWFATSTAASHPRRAAALALFPTRIRNPHGTKAISTARSAGVPRMGRPDSTSAATTSPTRPGTPWPPTCCATAPDCTTSDATSATSPTAWPSTTPRSPSRRSRTSSSTSGSPDPAAASPGEVLSGPAAADEPAEAEAIVMDLSRRSTPPRAGSARSNRSSTAGPAPGTSTATTATSSCCPARTCSTGAASASSGLDRRTRPRRRHRRLPPQGLRAHRPRHRRTGKGPRRLGLLDEALALDLRRPQDYFHRLWNLPSAPPTSQRRQPAQHEGEAS